MLVQKHKTKKRETHKELISGKKERAPSCLLEYVPLHFGTDSRGGKSERGLQLELRVENR